MAIPRLYLGYGLLANQALIEELLGRPVKPWELETTIRGFDLRILKREELPRGIQDATDEGFRMYGLTENPRGKGIRVRILELTGQEKAAVNALNFGSALFEERRVFIGVSASVDILRDRTLLGEPVADCINYRRFLNGEQAAMALARKIREGVLGSPEGNPRGKER